MKEKQLFGDTDGIRGKANQFPLDGKTLIRIGKSLGKYCVKLNGRKNSYKVIIGRDTRESSLMIEKNLSKGLTSCGVNIYKAGIIPTPGIPFLIKEEGFDLGIMITASHNPYTDNGIKVFKNNGSKTSDEEEIEIEKFFYNNDFTVSTKKGKSINYNDTPSKYIDILMKYNCNISLSGLTIVVDSANGSNYIIAPDLYKSLGAKVYTISNKPNGKNINKNCGVLFPDKLRKEVLKRKADLGIAFDGDADRNIFIDEKGNLIDGDYIMSMIAIDMKKKGTLKNDGIVVTQYSNLALDKHLAQHGIKTERVLNGDKFVSKLCEERGYVFGGENSGHYIFMNISDSGDGLFSSLNVLKILKESKKPLSEIAITYKKNPQKQYIVPVMEKKPIEELSAFTYELKKWEERLRSSGRIFARYSGTQNIFRILVEDESIDIVKTAGDHLSELIYSLIGDPDENYYIANE